MQYHALSLAHQAAHETHIIGYPGSEPIDDLKTCRGVHFHYLPIVPAWIAGLPRLLTLIFKVIQQLIALCWLMLVQLPSPGHILLQNPPAIPTMMVCWLASRRHGARFVIDWHNYAYSILALGLSPQHPIVRLARWYERFCGKRSDAGFCVTEAMRRDLATNWGVRAAVLYDRPAARFRPISDQQRHAALLKLQNCIIDGCHALSSIAHLGGLMRGRLRGTATILTQKEADGSISKRRDRPAVVVSSTSWTPDEDFGILLEAAKLYDAAVKDGRARLPFVLFIITGKGPQKQYYVEQLRKLNLGNVAFSTVWLEAEDYPLLLAAADLGVCLHTSSSGLDLPMKIIDMFGSGLPVCAADYSCIQELVAPGCTGLLFKTPDQLAQHLIGLLTEFSGTSSGSHLARMRQNVLSRESVRWEENWAKVAGPVFR